MERISTTPFGQRPVTAGFLASQALAQAEASIPEIDKWDVLQDLTAAKKTFGVSDRDLTVLHALLTFHKARVLEDGTSLIVFPSNKTLSKRAHGMAESTLRRHLAVLVSAGLIARHDSPNGKRYAAKDRSGEIARAFGLDLRPLLVRAEEITKAAFDAREAAEAHYRARERVVLKLRDANKLIAFGMDEHPDRSWPELASQVAEVARMLRRKLVIEEFEALHVRLSRILMKIEELLHGEVPLETTIMGGNDSQNERHQQSSKPNIPESEPCLEESRGQISEDTFGLPLPVVMKACPEALMYAKGPVRSWHDLIVVASDLRGMLGISLDAWDEAQRLMGSQVAAITIVAILQRFEHISSPGGYLRALARKADEGTFSPGPMVMALLNTSEGQAA